MSKGDMERWDRRHARSLPGPLIMPAPPPPVFAHLEDHFPDSGNCLEIACGRGDGAVWLAGRGLNYRGVDVSPVAIDRARQLVAAYGLDGRCRLEVWDLDDGLPPGDPVDLVFCHLFRDPTLYEAMIERLAPGGTLALATLSEVGGKAGRHRARPGELIEAFQELDVIDEGEAAGTAWILARRR